MDKAFREIKVSVVVICWNSIGNLRDLLDSLPAALANIKYEVIVVDNGSVDGTGEVVATHYPDVRYVGLLRNFGVAYARNRGIERSSGEFIWLLDDDTIVNSMATEALLEFMDRNPMCGLCACQLRDESGSVQLSYKPYPSVVIKLRNVLGFKPVDPYRGNALPFEPEYVIGACQLIRREVFEQVGLLDENIFYGPEDADFCMRVRQKGWHVIYIPYVHIVHRWKRITARKPFSKIGRRHIAALFYFYIKHRRFFK